MKIKDYEPQTQESAIAWIMEEAAEGIIVCARCLRFGIETVYDAGDGNGLRPNALILLEEISDLKRSIEIAERIIARTLR